MKLRIYFSATWHDSASSCEWALGDDSGNVLQSGSSHIAELPKADEYIAIISSTRLMCVNVQMPSQSRRRWETALPFVAEEYTLTDPEENHVVPGATQANGQRSLFVVDKLWLQSIVSAFASANLALRLAVPEMLMPGLPQQGWVIVWDGNKGFMRTGPTSGIALDHGDEQHSPVAFTLSLNAAMPVLPQKVQIRFPSDIAHVDQPRWPNMPVEHSVGERWNWRSEPIPNDTLNLLWGSFAPKTRLLELLPKLKPVALIILAAILIETVGTNIEWGLLSHQKNSVTQEMNRTFLKTFGESSVLVNPPLQMQRNIAALRHTAGLPDEADFLSLLDQSSSTLSKLPSGSITSIHYESGRLDIDIKLRNEADIKSLQLSLQSKGLSIRLGDIRNTGSGVETRLAIQTGGIL